MLGTGVGVPFHRPITHPETANLLRRCRHCSRLIDDHSIGSGDRFFSHRYCGALRQEIPLISDRQLRKTIDGLKRLERKCFASRSRFAFYDYLAAVLELFVQLRRTKQAKKAATRIAKLSDLRNRKRTHPIRVIIDATSTADLKTRSRWTRALRFAWRKRRAWRDLTTFLRENDGPAGCAEQFAAVHPKARHPGCIVYRCPGTGRPYLIVQKELARAKAEM
jgi:hypothetical protein